MTNLAVWRIDESGTSNGGQAPLLSPVERSHLDLEKHLEDWITADVKLIGGGLTIVGRQVRIDDGILDLLAIDARDRWVVIELKAGPLDDRALHQALYYAASLARLADDDLRAKLEPGLGQFGDAKMLAARLRQLLDAEVDGGPREIAVTLVGVGLSDGLERMPLQPLDRRRQLRGVQARRRPQAPDSRSDRRAPRRAVSTETRA